MNLKEFRRLIHNKFPEISSMLYRYKMNKYYRSLKTINGFTGTDEMHKGTFDKEVTEAIIRQMDLADIFLDCGANFGYYGSLSKIPVIAIEPHPENVKVLMKNLPNAIIFPMALSNSPRIITLYGWGTGASVKYKWMKNPAYSTKVPATTLDYILFEKYKEQKLLIKVDVEGAELSILQGSFALFHRAIKPIWIVESHNVWDIMNWFVNYKHTKINDTNHLFEPI